MNLLELHAPEIREHIAEHRDDDAGRKLWLAVMKRTLTDLRYLRRYIVELRKHQMEEIRDIQHVPAGNIRRGCLVRGDLRSPDSGC